MSSNNLIVPTAEGDGEYKPGFLGTTGFLNNDSLSFFHEEPSITPTSSIGIQQQSNTYQVQTENQPYVYKNEVNDDMFSLLSTANALDPPLYNNCAMIPATMPYVQNPIMPPGYSLSEDKKFIPRLQPQSKPLVHLTQYPLSSQYGNQCQVPQQANPNIPMWQHTMMIPSGDMGYNSENHYPVQPAFPYAPSGDASHGMYPYRYQMGNVGPVSNGQIDMASFRLGPYQQMDNQGMYRRPDQYNQSSFMAQQPQQLTQQQLTSHFPVYSGLPSQSPCMKPATFASPTPCPTSMGDMLQKVNEDNKTDSSSWNTPPMQVDMQRQLQRQLLKKPTKKTNRKIFDLYPLPSDLLSDSPTEKRPASTKPLSLQSKRSKRTSQDTEVIVTAGVASDDAWTAATGKTKKHKMCYPKGTYLIRFSDLDKEGYNGHIWYVDNHQLIQMYALDGLNLDGGKDFSRTERYSGWLCDCPWYYYAIASNAVKPTGAPSDKNQQVQIHPFPSPEELLELKKACDLRKAQEAARSTPITEAEDESGMNEDENDLLAEAALEDDTMDEDEVEIDEGE